MKIEEIRKLCDAAAPGPWSMARSGTCGAQATYRLSASFTDRGGMRRQDAEFCAAARELMPKLLAVAEAAKLVASEFEDIATESGLLAAIAALEASP